FAIGGTIAPDTVATVSYEVTVNAVHERGDNSADNWLVVPGEEPPAEVECADAAQPCTSTPLPAITAEKTSEPENGATVQPGDEITYTLHFVNAGDAEGSVDFVDDLSGVLDDAEMGESTATPGLVAELDGTTLSVTGTLGARERGTVQYTVRVLDNRTDGDDALANVLVPGGAENPGCDTPGASCTTHVVPRLDAWKQVEASETPVAEGTELHYTLSFENSGKGAADVDYLDQLVHVLDDADATVEPTSETLEAVRDGDT